MILKANNQHGLISKGQIKDEKALTGKNRIKIEDYLISKTNEMEQLENTYC